VVIGLQWPAPPASQAAAASGTVSVGSSVYVNVSVATLWVSRGSPRTIDAPALSRPVYISRWLRAMSTATRLDLVGRVETQALYGERLLVTDVRKHWLQVVAVAQATRRDSRGYPGWVPRRQVTSSRPVVTTEVATVIRLVAPLQHLDGRPAGRVSFGTRLPVLGVAAHVVRVATPTGRTRTIDLGAVAVSARTAPARPQTVRALMNDARGFIGVPYLWGGRSGFAVDCSGFTNLVYGAHGVRLPRDANDQAVTGRAVASGDAHAGDLAFFSAGSGVSHVGFVTADGRLLNARRTGQTVSVTSLTSRTGLVGMRRYL